MYHFGEKSRQRRIGVHPALVAVSDRALSYGVMDMTVLHLGGARTLDQQKDLVQKGASKTMKSRHLIQSDGYGHALDLAPYPVDWNDIDRFMMMGSLMFRAAAQEGVILTWGGHWPSFKDYPHFQFEGYHKDFREEG